ncbi:MAG TPA: hypothetical protein VFA64_12425 [Hyphomicrobiaceae bacterium]|nr:hypothetical protein [Hyphomicrobiaceae bacterium]
MKTMLPALAAVAFIAGAAVPASAGEDVVDRIASKIAERIGEDEVVDLVKARPVYVPRQIEYDFSRLPVGSAEWWRQRDRERGGRR